MAGPTIFLLSGWSGSGKDVVAWLLIQEMQFERLAFADGLKSDVSKKSGIPLHYFHDRELKDTGSPSPRQLLLSEARAQRANDPDIYCRRVADTIHNKCYVITDWRYRREYDYFASKFDGRCRLIRGRIIRPGIFPSDDPSEHDLNHESFDIVLHNNGTINDLRDTLLYQLGQKLRTPMTLPASAEVKNPFRGE